jgi:hypothetical protein
MVAPVDPPERVPDAPLGPTEKLTLPDGVESSVPLTVAETMAASQVRPLASDTVTVGGAGGTLVWAVAWDATSHRRAVSATTAAATARTNDTLAPLGFILR